MAISNELRNEIMRCVFKRADAELLLEQSGFPPQRFPAGDGEAFWLRVFREIDNGILPNEGLALAENFSKRFPYNRTGHMGGMGPSGGHRPGEVKVPNHQDQESHAQAFPTILFLSTDPYHSCSFDKHYQTLADLHGLPRLIPAMNAFLEDLGPTIIRRRPTILHFCGHCEERRGTEFQTRAGTVQTVDPQTWHDLVRGLNDGETSPLQLVVFNTCHSDQLARVTASACAAAVGYEGPVNEDETIVFARSFYASLVQGQSIAYALNLGRAQLKAQGCGVAARALRLHTRGHRHGGELRLFTAKEVP